LTACLKEAIEYYPIQCMRLSGRVAERLKAAASKAVEGLMALREFESHPFRHKIAAQFYIEKFCKNFFGEMSEMAEGARLEIVCAVKSGTEGSNPSLSAIIEKMPKMPKIGNA
jgi:hypothetical protein